MAKQAGVGARTIEQAKAAQKAGLGEADRRTGRERWPFLFDVQSAVNARATGYASGGARTGVAAALWGQLWGQLCAAVASTPRNVNVALSASSFAMY